LAVGEAIRGEAILFTGHHEAIIFAISLSRGNRGKRAVDGV
jgi:hypothetical protein